MAGSGIDVPKKASRMLASVVNTLCLCQNASYSQIELRMHAGNQPALLVTSSLRSVNVNAAAASDSSRSNATVHVETNDGTTEREFCNAGGEVEATSLCDCSRCGS